MVFVEYVEGDVGLYVECFDFVYYVEYMVEIVVFWVFLGCVYVEVGSIFIFGNFGGGEYVVEWY